MAKETILEVSNGDGGTVGAGSTGASGAGGDRVRDGEDGDFRTYNHGRKGDRMAPERGRK